MFRDLREDEEKGKNGKEKERKGVREKERKKEKVWNFLMVIKIKEV